MNVQAEIVQSAFAHLLEKLTPEPDRMRLMEATFRRVWEDKLNTVGSDADTLRKERAKLEVKRKRILDKLPTAS